MTQPAHKIRDHEWLSYYDKFSYFSTENVRDGCHPRIMEHPGLQRKAIVLVHGLSDSPYFMTAIGEYFFTKLGYNVYLPLLHCHGLKDPQGIEDVELQEWKANVSFAIQSATLKAEQVSIGGFSTGGTLSFYMAATRPRINGSLYLFSGALDLTGVGKGFIGEIIGEVKEFLLRTFPIDVIDTNAPLIGKNPYRYTYIDLDGAKQLAMLIKETDTITNEFSQDYPFPVRVFAAHSECDNAADISGVEKLESVSAPGKFNFFRIPQEDGVSHSELVLKDPILLGDEMLEKSNPRFQEMVESIAGFE
jgi:pimeloyl-ACP methyl ester carboxylesterase